MKVVVLHSWESKVSFRFLLLGEISVCFHVRKRKQQRAGNRRYGGNRVDDGVKLGRRWN